MTIITNKKEIVITDYGLTREDPLKKIYKIIYKFL